MAKKTDKDSDALQAEVFERQARICKAFANSTRLHMLDLLGKRDWVASELQKQLGRHCCFTARWQSGLLLADHAGSEERLPTDSKRFARPDSRWAPIVGVNGGTTTMAKALPKRVNQFSKQHPKIWEAFNELGERCHEAGPLDEKTRRLIKLALSIGAGLEGATHSAVRNARSAGITVDEINHVALLAITTLGFPSAIRAMTWIGDLQETK